MGSTAHVTVAGGRRAEALADEAVRRIADLEQRWSRFVASSEVSELNRRAGEPVEVSAETALLVERARAAWDLSGGAFDPTVLGAVVRAGYDRTFADVAASPRAGWSPLTVGAADICVRGRVVRLPAGTGFDPGGIGKGLAADMVCAGALDAGAERVCVNLGGDVRVAGGGWTIGVDHPGSPEPIALLGVADGAVATSTTLLRRWEVDGAERHHLIDPRTGRPSDSDLTLATVVAGEAWMAEVLAKAVLLAGSAHPFDIVGGTPAESLAVDRAGAIRSTPGLARYVGAHSATRPSLV